MGQCITTPSSNQRLLQKLRGPKNTLGKPDIAKTVSVSNDSQDDHNEKDLGAILRPMITSFVSDIGFTTAPAGPTHVFWTAMQEYADKIGVNYDEGTHSWKCVSTL